MTDCDFTKDQAEAYLYILEEEVLEHAKEIKKYCRMRDKYLDDCCEGCPFHFYLGASRICVLNDGSYPNEWHDQKDNKKICQYRDEDGCCWTDEKCKYQSNDEVFCQLSESR